MALSSDKLTSQANRSRYDSWFVLEETRMVAAWRNRGHIVWLIPIQVVAEASAAIEGIGCIACKDMTSERLEEIGDMLPQ